MVETQVQMKITCLGTRCIVIVAIVIGVITWLVNMWTSGSDTLRKQKILAEEYGGTPISTTASGFWTHILVLLVREIY